MILFNKILLALLLALSVDQASCGRAGEVEGTVKDFTGLDGCRLLIELEDGKRLEPQKLPEGVTLEANRRVAIRYREMTGQMSICMVGPVVEITSLRYL
ncbi:MAG TPA: hypothetical protein VEB63_06300 [Chitinophagaceae bacterium]|nr:hypothetical protein [Chitinophagaceae bacterium]